MAYRKPETKTVDSDIAASAVNAVIAKNRESFLQIVEREKLALTWESESSFAEQIVTKSASLMNSTAHSLNNAIGNIARVGLTLNPVKQHATIVPRWNYKLKQNEAHLMVMYRGYIALAAEAGVHDIIAEVVYEADNFQMERTHEGDKYSHKIAFSVARGGAGNKFVGVYVAAVMPGGRLPKVEWIPADDIYKMRDKSDSYLDDNGAIRPGSPWVVWFDEMAKKSGIKRAQKRWEEIMDDGSKWERFQRAVAIDNEAEGVIKPRASDIEGKATVVPGAAGDPTPDAKPAEEPKLSTDQITAIREKATDAGFKDLTKIVRAYNQNSIEDVPAKHYDEILQRLAEAKKLRDSKKNGKSTSKN